MVNPIRYVGLWNWRTKELPNPSKFKLSREGWRDRFHHSDVSVATSSTSGAGHNARAGSDHSFFHSGFDDGACTPRD
jgi:hypothetical protein